MPVRGLDRQLRQPHRGCRARSPSARAGSTPPRTASRPCASGRPISARRILAHVPMRGGEVVEEGDFELDGVTFPAAEIRLEFLHPGGDGEEGGDVPPATVVDTWTYRAWARSRQHSSPRATRRSSSRRPASACAAGPPGRPPGRRRAARALRGHPRARRGRDGAGGEARRRRARGACTRPRSPSCRAGGLFRLRWRKGDAAAIDLNVRMLSMGKLHHAMTGTGAVATAVAAAIPGTVPQRVAPAGVDPRHAHRPSLRRAHRGRAGARGTGAGRQKAVMSRSARRLMEGWVRVPRQ